MAFCKKQFNKDNAVWYPQAITVGKPVTTHQVAKRLAQISTVSEADAYAVLIGLREVLGDYMAQGKSVEIEGLGNFRYGLDTVGVKQEKDFDPQAQIKAVRVRFIPEREGAATRGGTQTRALVPNDLEWVLLDGAAATSAADEEEEEEPGTGQTPDGEEDANNPLA